MTIKNVDLSDSLIKVKIFADQSYQYIFVNFKFLFVLFKMSTA